jgi:DNA-binding HxlR family transcriptional regulator
MAKTIQEETGCSNVEHSKCGAHIMAVRDALDILSGKWKLPIIISLIYGDKRFKQMERDITGITAKMLSKELKDLELNELVKRTVYDTMPVTVEYSLTDYGKTLKKVIGELHNWGAKHRERIMGEK